MKKQTFEEYLQDIHEKQYVGLDDEMPDDFNWWLENLEPEDYFRYAEKWHNSELRRVLEDIRDDLIYAVGHTGFCNCKFCKVVKRIDKELEGVE